MKKINVLVSLILFITLLFVGCSNKLYNKGIDFNYDLLLQMTRQYLSEQDDYDCYTSLTDLKTRLSQYEHTQSAFATVECIDTDFYITVRHSDGDIMISGKSVSKCNVVCIGEIFNNYNIKENTVVEIVQDFYIIPTNEKDKLDMFKSFGAKITSDKMKIKDGDYLLRLQEDVDYTLKIHENVLPMEPGMQYTCAILSYDSITTAQFLLPTDNAQRYEDFQISEDEMNIANEIQQTFEPEQN